MSLLELVKLSLDQVPCIKSSTPFVGLDLVDVVLDDLDCSRISLNTLGCSVKGAAGSTSDTLGLSMSE